MTRNERLVWIIWSLLGAGLIVLLILKPEYSDADYLKKVFSGNPVQTLVLFSVFLVIRSFTIFPLTPFIIAAAFIYSHQPWIGILLCWFGGQLASIIHYSFPHWIGVDRWAQKKFGKRLAKAKSKIEKHTFWYVFLACTFPIMPGELVYYLSGTMRIPFLPYQLAVAAGHLIVVTGYILSLNLVYT